MTQLERREGRKSKRKQRKREFKKRENRDNLSSFPNRGPPLTLSSSNLVARRSGWWPMVASNGKAKLSMVAAVGGD